MASNRFLSACFYSKCYSTSYRIVNFVRLYLVLIHKRFLILRISLKVIFGCHDCYYYE